MRHSKPYSIMSPPFSVTSGGIRVMYGLYGWLLAKGQVAFMNAQFENRDFIAVYPEIYHDNPAEANTVVRYILAPPGEMASNGVAGPTKYPETDQIFSFSKMIYETDDEHTLFLPILNTHLFTNLKRHVRPYKCVFVGKGTDGGLHPQDCIPVDRNLAQDQAHLADFLNDCEVMYCYDHRSAMTEVARLCGCRVVVIPSIVTKEQFSLYEPGMNGISWGLDEKVELDSDAFRDHYLEMKEVFSSKLDKFISLTQSD